ncbi:odorant receptor 49b isoform X2 [Megachile rotundata]|uniref:odorant receptor 49b isoform X2 n=1 Tax=Megachile rotundata TaxID=143995 RepID=UPI003FCFAF2E
MDSTQYKYLKNSKYYLCLIGQWPHQSTLQKFLIGMIFIPTIAAQTILQCGGLVTAWIDGDMESFLEGFAPFVISLMCLAKFINFVYNHDQMKRLLDIMQEDWKIYKEVKNEYNIICEQYAAGNRIVTNFAAFLFGVITPFAATTCILNIADAVGFYNLSGERPLTFRIEHFVDVDKYYYPLMVHSYFGTVAFTAVVVAVDSIIIIFVIHECGLCEILRYRLENCGENHSMDIKIHPDKKRDIWYQDARSCVLLHRHIIEFADIIENANTMSYFFQLGLNMICVSFTQFQAIVHISTLNQFLRYVSLTISLLCDLLFVSWPGQRLIDYTERIFTYATNNKWYQSSIKARTLLGIMLAKSMKPLQLTACRIYTLNMENFSTVLRTSFSYSTVLCSFQ